MKTRVIYVHGKGGNAQEAAHYEPLLPGCKVIGFDYQAQTPWQAREEFPAYFQAQRAACDRLILIANSIGAYFALCSLDARQIDQTLLISPIVDMVRLIGDMMRWANVSEDELQARGEIPTAFGETLSWRYLCDAREHPIVWHVPTFILYGEHDNLTSFETISAFAARNQASLAVMPGGEHWFHTPEQLAYLDAWCRSAVPTANCYRRIEHETGSHRLELPVSS